MFYSLKPDVFLTAIIQTQESEFGMKFKGQTQDGRFVLFDILPTSNVTQEQLESMNEIWEMKYGVKMKVKRL